MGEGSVLTSVVAAAELRFGAAKRASTRLTAQLDAILGALEIAPLEPPVDAIYADVRLQLERSGTPIDGNDLLIGAHALALGCTVVTANLREFGRVPGLEAVDWPDGA